jgi:hypothetical protein
VRQENPVEAEPGAHRGVRARGAPAACRPGAAAGQQVLRRIFGSLDQQQQSDLAELLNSIEATIESTDLPDRP